MREKKCGILDYARRMKKEVVIQKVKVKYLKSRVKEIVEKKIVSFLVSPRSKNGVILRRKMMTTSDEFIDEEEIKNEHIATLHLLGGPYDGNLIYDTENIEPEMVFVKFPIGDEYDHQLEFTYWFEKDLETLKKVGASEYEMIASFRKALYMPCPEFDEKDKEEVKHYIFSGNVKE